jgi:tetratricopeptide (TPR) repeat protein
MALSYWGWSGTREDPVQYLKPFPDDKNVMPYEMASYVQDKTDLAAIVRWGGTSQIIKSLLAAGYPVVVEQGVFLPDISTGQPSWMGHYLVVAGYDDASQVFIVQDSYLPDGNNYHLSYDKMVGDWRSFDYVFLIVYPKDKKNDLFTVLGSYADEASSDRIAGQIASNEISTLSGVDQFFAWFNRGTSLVHLQDYKGAANAYDEAFKVYSGLPEDNKRPWRMMWYQTGPFYAYYFTDRYQDVVQLATITINAASQPYLEESFYWRARAEVALGDNQDATNDVRTSLKYHPGFSPSLDLMNQLGITN